MVIKNYREIKSRAKKTLEYTPWDVKKLVFIFSVVSLGLGVVQTGVNILLNLFVDQAEGLGGLELYSIFSGIASVLNMVFTIFSILWAPAILFCGLMLLRGENPWPNGMMQGLRKWRKILIFMALLILFAFALSMGISPIITIIALPFMAKNPDFQFELPETDAEMTEYLTTLSTETLPTPVLILCYVLILAVLIPVMYRTRYVMLLIMDEEHIGVIEAVRCSFRMTKGSCKQLIFMDLSFWWYYLLVAVAALVPMAGYLPFFRNWNVYLVDLAFSAGSFVLSLGVNMLGLMRVKLADAVAYDHLRSEKQGDFLQLPEGDTHG